MEAIERVRGRDTGGYKGDDLAVRAMVGKRCEVVVVMQQAMGL